jgi:tRNA-specific 2-thiouridylase
LRVARRVGIPFKVVNFEKQYKERVIEYFFAEYEAGRTPNPDVLCNREIKFGMLLDWATEQGYDAVATGHYARVEHGEGGSRLLKGLDDTKDQSYFLSQLNQAQLQKSLFPIGEMKKVDVRKAAEARDLPVADKPDSQGLCFVGQIDLAEFLQTRIPVRPGKVINSAGEVVGEHDGAAYYTIGQRRGLGVAAGVPMYVTKTDVADNTVTVGHDRDLYHDTVFTEPAHWLNRTDRKQLDVSIRYRMTAAPATVAQSDQGLKITFDEPQRGATPGQFAVLYDGDELVGSAVIR